VTLWTPHGDVNPARLKHAESVGFEIEDLSTEVPLAAQIAQVLGVPEVDSAIDAVGFEARAHDHEGEQHEAHATV
jgi:glutathione-independent formaldehyde dehydrogenase